MISLSSTIIERRNQPCASAQLESGSVGLARDDDIKQETPMKTSMAALCAFGISISCAYAHHAKHRLSHEARQSVFAASHKKSSSTIDGRPAHIDSRTDSNSSIDNPGPASNY
jgi:hypothetical protein